MKHKKIVILLFTVLAFVYVSASAFAADFIEPDQGDKCPVCGMFPYKYPGWIAEIQFKDDTYAVFDGPKDMLKYYFNVTKYNNHKTADDITEIYVTEYYSNEQMQVDELFFVLGSDVMGPMGMEFIPVKGKKEAETFMKDHKGSRMLTFDEIQPADIPAMKMKHH